MRYRVIEEYYGPDIRLADWSALEGKVASDGNALRLLAEERRTTVRRSDYLYGGGGDVELTLRCGIARIAKTGGFTAHFNAGSKETTDARGFRLVLAPRMLKVFLRDRQIGERTDVEAGAGTVHELKLATLGESYAVRYNGQCVAEGRMAPPYSDNEGWTLLSASNADARVESFSENFIARDVAVPAWSRSELLYNESFGPASFEKHWLCNRAKSDAGPEYTSDGYVFRHTCNCLLKERFCGPIAVDFKAAPVPTGKFSAGVTDAIFIWMFHNPDTDMASYLRARTEAGEAGLEVLNPLPLYWMDFGGTNNATTRLRKNPQRHLIRQFTDSRRLLQRNRTYLITCVQNGHFIEFWRDDQPMIQAYDPHPLTIGHVGARAFCSDLKLTGLKVWRIC